MKACAYIHNRQLLGWRTLPSSSYHQHQIQRKVTSSNNAIMKYGSRRSTNDIFHIIHTDTSVKRTTSSEDTATIWHMHRDECDDWLDEVLIDRLNSDKGETSNCKQQQQPSSLFKTAALVVENVMSGGAKGYESSKPLLRRIALEEGNDNNITDIGNTELKNIINASFH